MTSEHSKSQSTDGISTSPQQFISLSFRQWWTIFPCCFDVLWLGELLHRMRSHQICNVNEWFLQTRNDSTMHQPTTLPHPPWSNAPLLGINHMKNLQEGILFCRTSCIHKVQLTMLRNILQHTGRTVKQPTKCPTTKYPTKSLITRYSSTILQNMLRS